MPDRTPDAALAYWEGYEAAVRAVHANPGNALILIERARIRQDEARKDADYA